MKGKDLDRSDPWSNGYDDGRDAGSRVGVSAESCEYILLDIRRDRAALDNQTMNWGREDPALECYYTLCLSPVNCSRLYLDGWRNGFRDQLEVDCFAT